VFTGLIEEIGTVRGMVTGGDSARIEVESRVALRGTACGDSIAVNGACLTVTRLGAGSFTADAARETLARTNLGTLAPGKAVNLERALRLGDRLGGHLVSGHVDGTAILRAVERDGIARLFRFDCPAELLPLVAEKGSVALDGISLTVAALAPEGFIVSAVPHAVAHTTLLALREGDEVNLECDQIAKYLARLARFAPGPERPCGGRGLTEETLARFGF